MIAALNLPVSLSTQSGDFTLRRATEHDLVALVGLLSEDPIRATGGDNADQADLPLYRSALRELMGDRANEVLVVTDRTQVPLATMQLTRIPGMARRGSTRLLIEAVHVGSSHRSSGIGSAMMRWVNETAAPSIGASLVQLTSDEAREDAHRFYERLGFIGSHRGFKFRVE